MRSVAKSSAAAATASSWWGRRVLSGAGSSHIFGGSSKGARPEGFGGVVALRVHARGLHHLGGGSGRREGGGAGGFWQGGQDGRQSRGWQDYARESKLGFAAALGGAALVLGDRMGVWTPVPWSQCEESGWYTEPRDKAKGRDKDQMPIAETERVIHDFYEVLEELGSGVHASVRMGKNKQTGERVAVKCVDKANMRRRQLAREIEILTTVNHPNVISLKDVFEDKTYVYLVLELVEGGELFDKIVNDGAFSEQDASKMIRKMTSAIEHLHQRKICHRDLKPENLLLTSKGPDADIKIADFGLSKVLGEKSMMKRSCGTWAYWAPEILRRQPYDVSVDMWSLGVILYIMLSGSHPFDPDGQGTDAQIVEKILRADYKFDVEIWNHVSPSAKDVIRNLIHMDPHKRYTCEQLLRHPWVAGTDVSDSPMPTSALDSLRDFNKGRRQHFHKGLVGIVASQMYMRKANRVTLLESEIEEMRHVFSNFSDDPASCKDLENMGHCTLPVTSLATAMRALGEEVSNHDAMKLALTGDAVDMQGRVAFSSFVAIMANTTHGRETEEDLLAAFKFLDKEGTGTISASRIRRALAMVGVGMSQTEVEQLVREVDTGGKGQISYQEFRKLFENTPH